MASTAARSIFRSCSSARSAFRVVSEAKPARSPFRIASNKPISSSQSTLRFPVELSFCLESMMPYHTATASSLMTSMLSVSSRNYAWLSEGFPRRGFRKYLVVLRGNEYPIRTRRKNAKSRLFEDQEAKME